MKKISFFLLFLMIGVGNIWAQNHAAINFTLDQAVAYAWQHNYGMINSGKDLEVAKLKINEQVAAGLPQLNATLTYHDNVARPVLIIPGDLTGHPGQDIPVQFGARYDANLNGQLTQLIFDGRYLIGLKAAKISLEKTNKEFFKNKLAVKEQVSDAYFQVISIKESLRIVDSTLSVTKKMAIETHRIYEAGMIEDVDVDQVDLLVSNLEASHTFLKNQYTIAIAFFKFYLGLGEGDQVKLKEGLSSLIRKKQSELIKIDKFNLNQSVDFQMVKTGKDLLNLQVKLAKAAYLPSINAIVNYETQAQRNAWNFFAHDKWYQSAVIGVTMRIPVFSSGQRLSRLKQAKIAYEQADVLEKQTATQLGLEFQTAQSNYQNAETMYENKLKNRKIAEIIYNKTTEKYIQGMASSLDLLNTHNQFLNAENDYINAGLSLLKSAEKLQTLLTKAN